MEATIQLDIRAAIVDGAHVPVEVGLFEGGLPARNISKTVLVNVFTDFDDDGEPDLFDQDNNNDGVPDWSEIRHGFTPIDPLDADDDPDEGRLTNLEECLAGTDSNFNNDLIFKNGLESFN